MHIQRHKYVHGWSLEEAAILLSDKYVHSDGAQGLVICIPGGVYGGYKVLDEVLYRASQVKVYFGSRA